MKLRFLLLFLPLASTSLVFGQSNSGHVPGRILVQRVRRADSGAVGRAYQAAGAKVVAQIPNLDVDVLSVPEAAMPGIIRSLTVRGLFTFVESDGVAKGSAIP